MNEWKKDGVCAFADTDGRCRHPLNAQNGACPATAALVCAVCPMEGQSEEERRGSARQVLAGDILGWSVKVDTVIGEMYWRSYALAKACMDGEAQDRMIADTENLYGTLCDDAEKLRSAEGGQER